MPRRASEEIWSAEPLSHCKQDGQCRGRRTVSTGVAAGRDRQMIAGGGVDGDTLCTREGNRMGKEVDKSLGETGVPLRRATPAVC